MVDRDQPVGVAVRQGAEQHAVDDAEDRAVGADAQRERERRDEREARRLAQGAEGVAQVGEHGRRG